MENKVWNLIDESKNILILAHERPDGDAVGSSLAMYEALLMLNKKVTIVMQDTPKTFSFLNNYSQILSNTEESFDLAVVLDCSTKERIGQEKNLIDKCKKSINIDHHVSNTKYGDLNLVDEFAPSCSQIVYYLLKNHNIKINKSIGEAIAVGVLTDTNGFSNNDVNKDTFNLAAELVDAGINLYEINSKVLRIKTKPQFELQKLATSRLEFYQDGKIAFTYLTKEDFDTCHAEIGDHEGIVDIGRNIENVEVSVFIREEDEYYISLRSNGNVCVNEIAQKFNGGGHSMAAGGKIKGNFKETKEMLIEEIKKKLV